MNIAFTGTILICCFVAELIMSLEVFYEKA